MQVICGFSKGGVVLSALLRSCAEMSMWQNISELHFLDAGTYAEEVCTGITTVSRLL